MIDPDTLALIQVAAAAAHDKKAFEVVALDLDGLTSYTDCLLLCSAASDRQAKAIADWVARSIRDKGRRPLHSEGRPGAEWVLLDYGELIVHIFTETRRAYYGLDSLWGDAPRIDHKTLGIAGPGDAID